MSWLSTLLGGAPEDEDGTFFIDHDANTAAIISDGASHLEIQGTETWITQEMHHVAENYANNAVDRQGNQA